MDIGQILNTTIDLFFNIVLGLIFGRIILSWLPQYRYHPIAEFIYGITEPLLAPFQRFIPPMGQIDISPMVAIIALAILQYVLKFIVTTVFNLPLE